MPPLGTETQDVKVDANSSTDDIVKAAGEQADTGAEGAQESGADEQVAEGSEQPGGVKAEPKAADEDELDKGLPEGQAIPYDRFKKVNEERKALKARVKEFEESQGDDELDAILKDPEVAALILKKQGFTDEAIAQKFQEAGVEVKPKDGKEPTFDLTTVDGWDKKIEHTLTKLLDKRLGPVEKTLTEAQHKERMNVFGQRMDKEAGEAAKLCKDTFGIEYGDEKNANDPNTGVGKIMAYLEKHPEKVNAAANGALTKSDLLRLALADDGVKLGVKKGEQQVKDRVEKVKSAAMEGDVSVGSDKVPNKNSSVDEILAFRAKHPNWMP